MIKKKIHFVNPKVDKKGKKQNYKIVGTRARVKGRW